MLFLGPPRINIAESTNRTELYSYAGNPSPVTIHCVWWGHPDPTLSIRKNNKLLPSEDVQVKAPEDGLLSYLEATVMTDGDEDFGTYTCHATNRLGSATHVVVINKAGKWTERMGRDGTGPEGRGRRKRRRRKQTGEME